MDSSGYLYFHTAGTGPCLHVRRGFAEAWVGAAGIEVMDSGRLHRSVLEATECRALAAFASNESVRDTLENLHCPVWNYSHRLNALAHGRNLIADDSEVGTLAAVHLIEKGYTRFGFFGEEDTAFGRERFAAFQRYLNDWNLPVDRLILKEAETMKPLEYRQYRRTSIRNWLGPLPPPVGIFAANDSAYAPRTLFPRDRSIPARLHSPRAPQEGRAPPHIQSRQHCRNRLCLRVQQTGCPL